MSLVFSGKSAAEVTEKRSISIAGWTAVALSTIVTCFWAYWGIIENFHEGWYFETWPANVGLMLTQYLGPMLAFWGVTIVSIFFPRAGGALYVFLALFAAWFFDARSNTAILFIILPLIGLGALYWYGRPQPRALALALVITLPIITLAAFGIAPAIRVSQRLDEGNLGTRGVQGNGIYLIWAPAGPGWPRAGTNWYEARRACQFLSDDGLVLADTPENIWRLPSVDEAVRSLSRHGVNSSGEWDGEGARAYYERTPDKESPLWNVHSQVIYWWTATEVDTDRAYMIAYDGRVWPRAKQLNQGYLGFRCVKQP